MAVKMRRNFSGALNARIAADGTWRITRTDPPAAQIIVVGAEPQSVEACGATPSDVRIEWQGQRVRLTMQCAGRAAVVEARSAIVHEPVAALYASLPLAQFDLRARRFWRRVFLLVRIPGGRRLLKTLAHASRNKPG
jgi:hypothetical protein